MFALRKINFGRKTFVIIWRHEKRATFQRKQSVHSLFQRKFRKIVVSIRVIVMFRNFDIS